MKTSMNSLGMAVLCPNLGPPFHQESPSQEFSLAWLTRGLHSERSKHSRVPPYSMWSLCKPRNGQLPLP